MNSSENHNNTIFPKGDKASPNYFTGTAWVNVLVPKDQTGTYSIGNVVFEASCRNNWHTHAAGQTLIVIDGNGCTRKKVNRQGQSVKAMLSLSHLTLNIGTAQQAIAV